MIRKVFQITLCFCLSPLLVAQQVAQPTVPALTKPGTATSASGTVRILRNSTVVPRLEQTISSADVRVGDRVRFTLVNSLVSGGRVVAPAGTSCYATISKAHAKDARMDGYFEWSYPEVDLGHGKMVQLDPKVSGFGGDEDGLLIPVIILAPIAGVMWSAVTVADLARSVMRAKPAPPVANRETMEELYSQSQHFTFYVHHTVSIRRDRLAIPSAMNEPESISSAP